MLYHREGERVDGSTTVQLVVPGKLIPEVLFLNHDHALGGGHLGTTRNYYRIRKQYFWKNMHKIVDNYC